jgi:hypothetical protein
MSTVPTNRHQCRNAAEHVLFWVRAPCWPERYEGGVALSGARFNESQQKVHPLAGFIPV